MKYKILTNLIAIGIALSSFKGIAFMDNEGVICNPNMGEEVQTYSISDVAEMQTHYSGIDESVSQQETITFDHKVVEEYYIPGNLPTYYADQLTTNCANIAGAEVIAYYDKTYETLIPNYQVYIKLGSVIKYKSQTSEIEKVIQELYSLMGTDVNGAGTTFSGFEKGMKQYASNHGGYTYKSENILSFGNFSLGNFKKAIEAEKPVALFLPTYTIIKSVVEGSGNDTIYSSYETLAHVVVACGYRIDTYYNSNGSIKETKTYLKVASGFLLTGVTYIEVETSIFNEAVSIVIS